MLQHVLSFSVRHRWLVVLVTLAAAAGGGVALRRLPIDAVPDVTGVQVVVTTVVGGLGPEETEKLVTFPVESALAGTPGLVRTRSLSRNGFSQVTADFEDGADVFFARQQVAERLAEAKEALPPGADPRLGPVSTGLSNVYLWALDFAHPDGAGATVKPGEPGWQPDGS
jgi:cobalt-zinc-cadmium resistance protein CzcA